MLGALSKKKCYIELFGHICKRILPRRRIYGISNILRRKSCGPTKFRVYVFCIRILTTRIKVILTQHSSSRPYSFFPVSFSNNIVRPFSCSRRLPEITGLYLRTWNTTLYSYSLCTVFAKQTVNKPRQSRV